MEKILLVNDTDRIDRSAIEFACYMAKLTHSHVTGVFIENFGKEEVPEMIKVHGTPVVETIVASDLPDYLTQKTTLQENITFFKEACERRGVSSSVHQDKGDPIQELINESRFADLIIIDATIPAGTKVGSVPSDFVKNVLAESECPVIIAPLDFGGIEEILFAYDGSASSVFAIKQFTYLFPELEDKKATVLQVNKRGDSDIEQKYNINELLSPRYSSIGFQVLEGNADYELFGYLLGKKNIFLVMGAFGRSTFSTLFKPSNAELILKTINIPVFIAHR